MFKNKWLWLLGVAIFVAPLGLYSQSPRWQPVSRESAQRLLSENGHALVQNRDFTQLEGLLRALDIKPINSPPLTIYAFNSPRLCGVGGCLYSVYRQDTQQVLFKLLLNPSDSPSPPIFQTEQNCLSIKQPLSQRFAQINYCYIGDRYVQNPITYSILPH